MTMPRVPAFLLFTLLATSATTGAIASHIHDAVEMQETSILKEALARDGQSPADPTVILDALKKVDKLDNFGLAPLHVAVANGFAAGVTLLLDTGGADLDVLTGKGAGMGAGETPLMLAASGPRGSAVHGAIAVDLVQRGADRAAANKAGMTALHFAAKHGHVRIAAKLLDGTAEERAALVNARTHVLERKTKDGRRHVAGAHATPLHMAATAGGNERLVALLLARGADAEAVDRAGAAALHYAFAAGDVGAARALLGAATAPLLTENKRGKTPLDLAKAAGKVPEEAVAELEALHAEFLAAATEAKAAADAKKAEAQAAAAEAAAEAAALAEAEALKKKEEEERAAAAQAAAEAEEAAAAEASAQAAAAEAAAAKKAEKAKEAAKQANAAAAKTAAKPRGATRPPRRPKQEL